MNAMALPPLRRQKRRIDLSRVAGHISQGVALINSTVEPRAQYWDDWNQKNLQTQGPLWVALGDSVTQGIGSSDPSTCYVSIVLNRLEERTNQKWRLLNLSMSGARFSDVTKLQIPLISDHDLKPDLVSAIIGSNDIMWRRGPRRIANDAKSLMQSLPEGAYLSRVSQSNREGRRSAIADVFETMAFSRDLELFGAWTWPTDEGMWAQDKYHPNDDAYKYIADNLWASLHSTNFF